MPRYKLTLEYDGLPFHGWQRQQNGPSIQGALEDAVKAFSGIDATVQGAGRTDAGVHALGQVAHIDLDKDVSIETLRNALNHHLRPAPIAILEVARVSEDFHARFSARARHYRYRIVNRRSPLALEHGRAWHLPAMIEAEIMHEAGQRLIGRHDFTSFRSSVCQANSPVKTLDRLTVRRSRDDILVDISARSFLHHQVRNIVGTLKLIGEGKWPIDRIETILDARSRAEAGPTAPADGLYLIAVDY